MTGHAKPWFRRVSTILTAGLLLALVGCKQDPWTDGRYWRQPLPKKRVRPMSVSVGRTGDTVQSDVGPGFRLSSDWPEDGGGTTGRHGYAATEGVWNERSIRTGDWYDASRTGTHSEAKVRPSIAGGTVVSQSWTETTVDVRVAPHMDH